ncbi:MAG: GAF domain-containing protein [Calditrichaeota bacterium]|nr:MAG: GAF domain-containing protein [Calditrichota bacterium]MBL1206414.1 GAF domain-containing protein [Calditrichota bacterium]NOG46240.1 SpoIIE family protein phosphatase [Calditrichota bacterium]
MAINLSAEQKTRGIGAEQEEVLTFYKRLFNYKFLYIFPPVKQNTIKPLVAIGREENLSFYNARDIDWLNFYHKVLTVETLNGESSIDQFFEHYEIDRLFPIRLNDECFGFLALGSHGRQSNHLENQIAQLIIRYLASLWHNHALLNDIEDSSKKTEQLLAEISTLLEVTQAIESGGNIQNLLEMIMQKCMNVMMVEAVSLMLLTKDKKELEFRVALGPKGKDVKPYKLKLGQGIAGTVALSGKPLLIPNAYNDDRFDPAFDRRSGFKTESILCVPLIYHNSVLGVVQALNRFDGKPFAEHDLSTFKIFSTQAALAIENTRLLHEAIENEKLKSQIAIASEIQHLIVPEILPEIPGLEMSGCYIPSQGVGGDFYAVQNVNEHETIFCIADVSGKSVPGALLVSTLHATLRAYLEFTTDLQVIMKKLNELIIKLSTADRFITLFISKFNSKTSKLDYISAGHNPQYLLREPFKISKLSSTGVCVGLIPFDYKIKSVDLKKNDMVLLYTDGIVEARDKNKEIFGEERLGKVLFENLKRPCDFIQKQIIRAVETFSPDAHQQDDLTLLVIRKTD